MDIKKLIADFNADREKNTASINEFFADVVLGQNNWEHKMMLNGRRILVPLNGMFDSDEWTVFHRFTAVTALKKLQDDTSLVLNEEIDMIENSTPINRRQILPAVLMNAMKKAE